MSTRGLKLGRARDRLRRLLRGGWVRAVFATPRDPSGKRHEEVQEGPGAVDCSPEQIDAAQQR